MFDFDFGLPPMDDDLSAFDFADMYGDDVFGDDTDDGLTDNRYHKPAKPILPASFSVVYENAVKLVGKIKDVKGINAAFIVGGNFIVGDFIEALLVEKTSKPR